MGEYADQEIDRQMRQMFGIGYEPHESKPKPKTRKVKCPSCGKGFNSQRGVNDHLRDYHKQGAKNVQSMA
jgi:hypothetical protein